MIRRLLIYLCINSLLIVFCVSYDFFKFNYGCHNLKRLNFHSWNYGFNSIDQKIRTCNVCNLKQVLQHTPDGDHKPFWSIVRKVTNQEDGKDDE